ncbi:GNAT family N-acetyltransferase [Variovorax boronicumulans]|uniref:GNAT family N-acetyltransferase n=1 Tax=Variovorax boronicumulans TaxID=436515 RepID=UPI001C590011
MKFQTSGSGSDIPIDMTSSIPGLRFRHFSGVSDLRAMAEVANASDALDGVHNMRTPESMAESYASLLNCDPYTDLILAEVNGELAGYARGWWKEEVGGTVLHIQMGVVGPGWRRRGIGRAMLNWLESRQRIVGRRFPVGTRQLFNVYVTEGEVARAALMDSAGYAVARHLFSMARRNLDGVPAFTLPAGLEIRQVTPEHYAHLWAADLEAMREHWGRTEPGEAAYEAWISDKDVFQPRLWSVAWDTTSHQVVGQVRAFVREAENLQLGRLRGYTEFISVRKPWRRQGVARALIAHSLQLQARAGMRESALEVDSANATGATKIYEACGFEISHRNRVYRKPL